MNDKKHNQSKISDLHDCYLRNPPGPKDLAKAEREYLAVVRREREAMVTMQKLVKLQRVQAARKRKVLARHAELKAKMKAELDEVEGKSTATYNDILKLSADQKALKETLGARAEALLLANGSGPVVLDGKAYDFGCYGERVYLVPKAKGKAKR